MSKRTDLTGQRYGRLTVVTRMLARPGSYSYRWLCICDCPDRTKVVVEQYNLRSGNTQSCGCLQREMSSQRATRRNSLLVGPNNPNYIDGRSVDNRPEYSAWLNAKSRCFDETNAFYKDYGGRGITVCDRWLDFQTFLEDLGSKPDPSLSLERINNDGNYEPGNCKWATAKEQAGNRRPAFRGVPR